MKTVDEDIIFQEKNNPYLVLPRSTFACCTKGMFELPKNGAVRTGPNFPGWMEMVCYNNF